MAKPVEFSRRAAHQLDSIEAYYLTEAGAHVAAGAVAAILSAAERLGKLPVTYRQAARSGLREYVMERFPYILLYRERPATVEIVAILHQRQDR